MAQEKPLFSRGVDIHPDLSLSSLSEALRNNPGDLRENISVDNFYYSAKIISTCLEVKDPYTGGHSIRVFNIAKELGKKFNLNNTDQVYLEGGGMLHDIGKLGIRDAVLLKPGPLTDPEYKEMQNHPVIGAQIISKIGILKGSAEAILYHHERIDGYGYPYGLKGDEIPFIAKVISVIDAYDAMTTNRIYRKALSHEQAIEEVIRNSGTQFDSEIVKVFTAWWEETFQFFPERGKELYKGTVC